MTNDNIINGENEKTHLPVAPERREPPNFEKRWGLARFLPRATENSLKKMLQSSENLVSYKHNKNMKNEIKVGTEVLVDERVWGVIIEVYGDMAVVMDKDGSEHDGIHLHRLTALGFSTLKDAKDWVIDCAVDTDDQEIREEWAKTATPKQVIRHMNRFMDGGFEENIRISLDYNSQLEGNEWMKNLYKD